MKTSIFNASHRSLDKITPTLPNLSETLNEWFQTVTFILIKKKTENFQVVETQTEIVFQGVVIADAQNLEMRPEGERRWANISVYTTTELELSVDDIFNYNGLNYRLLQKTNYAPYGYYHYQAIEDYKR